MACQRSDAKTEKMDTLFFFLGCRSTSKLVFAENDKLHQSNNEGLYKLQSTGREHFQKIFGDHEKLKFQLETQKKELELRGKELEQREARNETERKKFLEELQQVLGVNLKQAAWLSDVPWGTMAISGHVAGTISDFFDSI